MNLYSVHVTVEGEDPAAGLDVYAKSASEAIAGALTAFADATSVTVECYLRERNAEIPAAGVDVLHADCFPK